MIQVLTHSGREEKYAGKDVIVNRIHDARALDEFDINIIDLDDTDLWKTVNWERKTIDSIADIISLAKMINNSNNTRIVVKYPQNRHYKYGSHRGPYKEFCDLKDMIPIIKAHILDELYYSLDTVNFVYENTETEIESKSYSASFWFENPEKALWCSKSGKVVVCEHDHIILTTLNIDDYESLILMLKSLGLIKENVDMPSWMEELKMFDDKKQYDIIRENNEIIKTSQSNIDLALEIIENNNRYKSILYTSGNELVSVVFEILEDMLGCDLQSFEDKKKEDFLFSIGTHIFIGEIKGVNHNVKSENVSQLDVHYQSYLENHPETDEKDVHALLIMDHQKKKPVYNREPVHDNQIALAKRNGCLIVDTYTLLKVYEKYRSGVLMREECIRLFADNTGLLKIE